MPISADEGAVKADIGSMESGDRLDLGGDEVGLGDAVSLMQQLEHRQLHPASAVVPLQRAAAHQDVQALSENGLSQGLLVLVGTQVGKQIVDGKLGVTRVAAHRHRHHRTILQRHHAPQFQWDSHPLILADAAIIVGLEESQFAILIQRGGLQVQSGAINVGGYNGHALVQGGRADDGQVDRPASVHTVHLHAGGEGHTPLQFHKAGGFGQLYGVRHTGTFRLALVQIELISLAVVKDSLLRGLVHHVPAVLLLVQQLVPQLLGGGLLFHF